MVDVRVMSDMDKARSSGAPCWSRAHSKIIRVKHLDGQTDSAMKDNKTLRGNKQGEVMGLHYVKCVVSYASSSCIPARGVKLGFTGSVVMLDVLCDWGVSWFYPSLGLVMSGGLVSRCYAKVHGPKVCIAWVKVSRRWVLGVYTAPVKHIGKLSSGLFACVSTECRMP